MELHNQTLDVNVHLIFAQLLSHGGNENEHPIAARGLDREHGHAIDNLAEVWNRN